MSTNFDMIYFLLLDNKKLFVVTFVGCLYLSNQALDWTMENWMPQVYNTFSKLMFLQISHTLNFEQRFWEKAATYLQVFLVIQLSFNKG